MDVDEAYNLLVRIGLISADDGYFPNHNTGIIEYDERLNAKSKKYLPEDKLKGIIFCITNRS